MLYFPGWITKVFIETGIEIGWTTKTNLIGNFGGSGRLMLQHFKGFLQPGLPYHLAGRLPG